MADDIVNDDNNDDFEFYAGTQYRLLVNNLLDDIITNNKKNKDKLITIIYNDVKTNNVKDIKDFKAKLIADKYEIELDYSSNGYVDTVTIEDVE